MEGVQTLKELALAAINQKLLLQGIGWDFYERQRPKARPLGRERFVNGREIKND